MSIFGGKKLGRELPKPGVVATVLGAFAVLAWLMALGVLTFGIVVAVSEQSRAGYLLLAGCVAYFAALGVAGAVALGLAYCTKYTFSTAVSAKLSERTQRDVLQKREMGELAPGEGSATHEEVVSLLAEIMENTLLGEDEKVAKRQLAKKHRQQALHREIEALIGAAKYRDAQQRLEEFRVRYPDSDAIDELEARLSEALRQHEQSEIAQVTEQVHRYMGLGLWERAMTMARHLAEQYPENPDATSLPETVRVEQQASQRQDEQRLYREIEHLAGRRHWRQALRVAETLLEKHPESPEANALKEQLPELRRNAAIMERREWEARITGHIQTGRHREAYDLAVELMEKYPDSPQAEAIRQRLDQLRERAGVEE